LLYLVATPIGNLADITQRALEILKACDYILCEDTRHSLSLLTHYSIQNPLKSYHKFSDDSRTKEIIQDLLSGSTIALISDAGTPGISDPGTHLVQQCIEHGVNVIAIPGACAAITALSCSGLNTDRFQFFGFLPRKSSELKRTLQEILTYPGTTICYESPNRLIDALKTLNELAPNRRVVVGRELTKKFEEMQRGIPSELISYWETNTLKGEIVLLISGEKQPAKEEWDKLTPEQHVAFLEETYQLSRQEAIKMAAKMRGVPKRDIYNKMLSQKAVG
jgi:16S rRNA (cytidine1402-2'-O)-methyltransferase